VPERGGGDGKRRRKRPQQAMWAATDNMTAGQDDGQTRNYIKYIRGEIRDTDRETDIERQIERYRQTERQTVEVVNC